MIKENFRLKFDKYLQRWNFTNFNFSFIDDKLSFKKWSFFQTKLSIKSCVQMKSFLIEKTTKKRSLKIWQKNESQKIFGKFPRWPRRQWPLWWPLKKWSPFWMTTPMTTSDHSWPLFASYDHSWPQTIRRLLPQEASWKDIFLSFFVKVEEWESSLTLYF